MDIIFVFVVLTDALILVVRVETDNQPPSDFKISDSCNVIIFGTNYGNLGRVIKLTINLGNLKLCPVVYYLRANGGY